MQSDSYNLSLTLTGKGMATVEPDIAIIQLGVETTGDNLSTIQSENAMYTQTALEALKQLGITDIKTIQYDISKIIDYENGHQINKGYRVRNILEISTNKISDIGLVIDTAVANGVNVVDQINFDVLDANKYYLEALNLAVMDAYEKAKSIIVNLGLMVEPIAKHIQEQSTMAVPIRNISLKEGAASTPIEAGNKKIEASVIVEYIY